MCDKILTCKQNKRRKSYKANNTPTTKSGEEENGLSCRFNVILLDAKIRSEIQKPISSKSFTAPDSFICNGYTQISCFEVKARPCWCPLKNRFRPALANNGKQSPTDIRFRKKRTNKTARTINIKKKWFA